VNEVKSEKWKIDNGQCERSEPVIHGMCDGENERSEPGHLKSGGVKNGK